MYLAVSCVLPSESQPGQNWTQRNSMYLDHDVSRSTATDSPIVAAIIPVDAACQELLFDADIALNTLGCIPWFFPSKGSKYFSNLPLPILPNQKNCIIHYALSIYVSPKPDDGANSFHRHEEVEHCCVQHTWTANGRVLSVTIKVPRCNMKWITLM